MTDLTTRQREPDNKGKPEIDRLLASIRDALSAIKFGTINLTVHDGRLVQMDVTERQRFTS